MPRDMFGDVVDPSIRVGGQKWYTVPLSILVHTVLIAAIIIIPLLAVEGLPEVPSMMAFVAAAPAAAAAPAPASTAGRRQPDAGGADQRQPERRADRGPEGNQGRKQYRCRL